ncbi:MAG TPA: ankyrin repeat domain-containing protein, partial [Ilumatobacteraceae bacterium]
TLLADASLAVAIGGPQQWPPLLHLAYARAAPFSERAVLRSARLLLDHGADPNSRFHFDGLAIPFTALTGAFGEGERGPIAQPPHRHGLALARLLLDSGADPNDEQALYNRMFERGTDHLVLLFEFGLGGEVVRDQLAWAVTHGMTDRVELLAARGVDIVSPLSARCARGLTPAAAAITAGYGELADLLVACGAPPPQLTPVQQLISAVLATDDATVRRLVDHDPDLLATARHERPSLVLRATVAGRLDAVRLAVSLGFDVNALGRSDIPVEEPWETPLHAAVAAGNVEMVRLLLSLGASQDVTDHRFSATPLGWAEHLEQTEVRAVLLGAADAHPG